MKKLNNERDQHFLARFFKVIKLFSSRELYNMVTHMLNSPAKAITGQKLKKESIDYSNVGKTVTTTTTYIDGISYESRITSPANSPDDNYSDVLQSIEHVEGRLRFTPSQNNNNAHLNYDYFIKDHLGNIRMVLTDEEEAFPYTILNFEGAPGSPEVQAQDRDWENKNGQSINVSSVRINKEFASGTPTGNYAMLVRKTDGAIGAGKLLKVMVGDRIHTSVDYFYSTTNANNGPASGISSLIAGFTSALLGSSAVTGSIKEMASDITGSIGANTALSGILNTPNKTDGNSQAPKAYLNILFFDDQFKFDNTSSIVIPVEYLPNQKGTLSKLGADALDARKNGYVYVYFSNESNEMVYFDNLMLTHEKGRVLEETHYYPFGLTMAGISSKALKTGYYENRQKYNGIEFNTDFNLNMYDAFYRNLDPQTGRFWQLDPKMEGAEALSPYASMSNNPVLFSDPLGDSSIVDTYGNVLYYDRKDKDLRVFMKDGETLTRIGELGKDINVDVILNNLLKQNSQYATEGDLLSWMRAVQQDGPWDYKDDYKRDKPTIFGIAWEYDLQKNRKKKEGSETFTSFSYPAQKIFFTKAADFGNFHAGYTGTWAAIPPSMQLRGAGIVEILKQAKGRPWIYPTLLNPITYLVAPYGDNRVDYKYNKMGMEYARKQNMPPFRTNNISNSMHYRVW